MEDGGVGWGYARYEPQGDLEDESTRGWGATWTLLLRLAFCHVGEQERRRPTAVHWSVRRGVVTELCYCIFCL